MTTHLSKMPLSTPSALHTFALACLACLACLLTAAPSGCSDQDKSSCKTLHPEWAPAPSQKNPAVATVNGVPILRSQLRAHLTRLKQACEKQGSAESHGTAEKQGTVKDEAPRNHLLQGASKAGCPPTVEDALNHLIDQELLAQEARRRGWGDDPEALLAAKNTAAHLLLERDFEAKHRPEDIPISRLKQAYKLNIRHFVRPELRRFAHILVRIQRDEKGAKRNPRQGKGTSGLKAEARAHDLAKAILSKAQTMASGSKLDQKKFLSLQKVFLSQSASAGFQLLAEKGVKARNQLVGDFADVLFGMDQPGEVAGPVETRFGYHIIFLEEILPARNIPFHKAKDKVLENVFPRYQKAAFKKYLQSLRERCRVEVRLENIPSAQVGCKKRAGAAETRHGL